MTTNRLKKIRESRGLTQREAAEEMGASLSHYIKLETGTRPLNAHWIEAAAKAFAVSQAEILDSNTDVPVMGYVGAGAEVEPDFEQVPPEGLDQVTISFGLPAEMVAFVVKGDSQIPKFDEGEVIVCYRDQRRGLDSFIGEWVVIRLADGRRFVKKLERDEQGYVLNSLNAEPIRFSGFQWVGEIYTVMPGAQFKRRFLG